MFFSFPRRDLIFEVFIVMKVIITESKFVEGILNYLNANFYPDYNWGPELHDFYNEEVKKYGSVDFYINDEISYDYELIFGDGVLGISSSVCEPLYHLFEYKWVPIFKTWFEENTGLEVNEMVVTDNEQPNLVNRFEF